MARLELINSLACKLGLNMRRIHEVSIWGNTIRTDRYTFPIDKVYFSDQSLISFGLQLSWSNFETVPPSNL